VSRAPRLECFLAPSGSLVCHLTNSSICFALFHVDFTTLERLARLGLHHLSLLVDDDNSNESFFQYLKISTLGDDGDAVSALELAAPTSPITVNIGSGISISPQNLQEVVIWSPQHRAPFFHDRPVRSLQSDLVILVSCFRDENRRWNLSSRLGLRSDRSNLQRMPLYDRVTLSLPLTLLKYSVSRDL
jgi:hypothetical protein